MSGLGSTCGSAYVIETKRPCENVARTGTLHLTDAPADVRAAIAAKGITVLPCVVQATDSWQDYRRVALGTVELPAGRVSVVLRPRTLAAGALMDIRGIELLPATKPSHGE